MSEARASRHPASPGLPEFRDRIVGWRDRARSAEVLFLGRRPDGGRTDALPVGWCGGTRPQARMRQVHGAEVLAAHVGDCGEGDALVTGEPGLALVVVTADCVPVLLATTTEVAAIHAGWRGFVRGILEATVARFAEPAAITAWIGPAIGPCCYEVGEEVATAVVERSTGAVRSPGPRGRPHLDLPLAAEIALARAGVGEIRRISCCTSCHPQALESFRRDGRGAGRNTSLIWLAGEALSQDS